MKKLAIALGLVLTAGAFAQTYVSPYTRSDGTFVPGHFRSAPDSSRLNNYSTQGNTNPYTGQQGTVNPYQPANPYGTSVPVPSVSRSPCHINSVGAYVCN